MRRRDLILVVAIALLAGTGAIIGVNVAATDANEISGSQMMAAVVVVTLVSAFVALLGVKAVAMSRRKNR
jgi:hypothetical protein